MQGRRSFPEDPAGSGRSALEQSVHRTVSMPRMINRVYAGLHSVV